MHESTTHAKFHLGRDAETKVFRTLVFALTVDKETVLCSQTQPICERYALF